MLVIISNTSYIFKWHFWPSIVVFVCLFPHNRGVGLASRYFFFLVPPSLSLRHKVLLWQWVLECFQLSLWPDFLPSFLLYNSFATLSSKIHTCLSLNVFPILNAIVGTASFLCKPVCWRFGLQFMVLLRGDYPLSRINSQNKPSFEVNWSKFCFGFGVFFFLSQNREADSHTRLGQQMCVHFIDVASMRVPQSQTSGEC